MRKSFLVLDLAMISSNIIPKHRQQKKTVNWTPSKFKTLGYQSTLNNKVKRQPVEWEKIFADHISDKELISKIYRELLKLHNKKHITQFKNGERTYMFFQRKHTTSHKALEKMPNITNCWRNANQNHSVIAPHTH